jgi:serine/threonine-protein kinase
VIAGTGKPGLSGDGGAAECAQLNRPMGISFDMQDNLYIADTGNQRVRLVRPTPQPADCNH